MGTSNLPWHQLCRSPIVFPDGSLDRDGRARSGGTRHVTAPREQTSRPVHERHAGGVGGESSLRGCHEQHRAGGVTTAEVGRELSGRICCCRAETTPTSFFTVTVEPAGALPVTVDRDAWRFVGADVVVAAAATSAAPSCFTGANADTSPAPPHPHRSQQLPRTHLNRKERLKWRPRRPRPEPLRR